MQFKRDNYTSNYSILLNCEAHAEISGRLLRVPAIDPVRPRAMNEG
jgi:hypothetical protein